MQQLSLPAKFWRCNSGKVGARSSDFFARIFQSFRVTLRAGNFLDEIEGWKEIFRLLF